MTEQMTDEQKKFCNQVAQWMERIREFPGGTTFLVDLFVSICATQSLDIVDRSDPSISLRREITQELYDALWTSRELRKSGYTMQTAGKIGLADLYAAHGVPGLQRFLEVATNNALHNAGLSGISLSPVHNAVN
jgi:hypothetical protein